MDLEMLKLDVTESINRQFFVSEAKDTKNKRDILITLVNLAVTNALINSSATI